MADRSGNFTYTVLGNVVTITDFPTTVAGEVVIPEMIGGIPVREIGVGAFADCGLLTAVTLPSTLKTISDTAFANCAGLTEMVLPEGITSLGVQAFLYCTGLTELHIPASLATAVKTPFAGCTSLASITVDPANANFSSVDGVFYDKAQTTLIQCPAGKVGHLNIPATVQTIGYYAVSRAAKLTGVTIPDGVTTLENGCFFKCAGLQEVTIPGSVLTIGANSFSECVELKGILIPGTVKEVLGGAFLGCLELADATISDGVTTLGREAFSNCPALRAIHLPATLTKMGESTFRLCISLESVSVDPANPVLSSVDGLLVDHLNKTFLWCSTFRSGEVEIPAGLEKVGDYAFRSCKLLTSISVPPSVVTFGSNSLWGCDSLRRLSVPCDVGYLGGGLGRTHLTELILIPSERSSSVLSHLFLGMKVTHVVISEGVTALGDYVFLHNAELGKTVFLGDAPVVGSSAFAHSLYGNKIYFFDGAAGFTTPSWQGLPSFNMGPKTPEKLWRVSRGLPYDAPMSTDHNDDGVSHLMAYALGLEPGLDLSGRLPRPVVSSGELSMDFFAGTPGITYEVQTSENLVDWTDEGVALSPPDAGRRRRASFAGGGGTRFMRLVVSE